MSYYPYAQFNQPAPNQYFGQGFNNPFNPQQYMMDQNQKKELSIVAVNGIEGARSYHIEPGSKPVPLFDRENDIFYIKSIDEFGKTTIKTYEFKPVETGAHAEQPYVTKKEFDELKEMIVDVKQYIRSTAEPSNAEPVSGANSVNQSGTGRHVS